MHKHSAHTRLHTHTHTHTQKERMYISNNYNIIKDFSKLTIIKVKEQYLRRYIFNEHGLDLHSSLQKCSQAKEKALKWIAKISFQI